jgi:hypothetical protein
MSLVNSCWELTNIADDEDWPEELLAISAVFAFDCVNNYDSSLKISNLVPSSQPAVDSGGLPLALCDRTERHLSRACAQCGAETCCNLDEETLDASCPCLMKPARFRPRREPTISAGPTAPRGRIACHGIRWRSCTRSPLLIGG